MYMHVYTYPIYAHIRFSTRAGRYIIPTFIDVPTAHVVMHSKTDRARSLCYDDAQRSGDICVYVQRTNQTHTSHISPYVYTEDNVCERSHAEACVFAIAFDASAPCQCLPLVMSSLAASMPCRGSRAAILQYVNNNVSIIEIYDRS